MPFPKHFRSGHCSWARGLTGLPSSRRGGGGWGCHWGSSRPGPGSGSALFISSSPYRAEVRALCLAQGRAASAGGGVHAAAPSAPTTCQDEASVPQAQGIRKYPKEGMVCRLALYPVVWYFTGRLVPIESEKICSDFHSS